MKTLTENTKRSRVDIGVRLIAIAMVAVLVFAGSAQAVVISFETSEGFPAAQGDLEGAALPAAFVDNLDSDQLPTATSGVAFKTGESGNNLFGEALSAVSGTQYAGLNVDGSGPVTLTVDLKNSANLTMVSFWYANRGNFVPGLTVEYFGLDEASLGSESYSGSTDGGAGLGLNAGFGPEFDLITVSLPAAVGTPLSKVAITSTTTSTTGHASFFIDDITFTAIPEPASLALLGLAAVLISGSRSRRVPKKRR